MPEHVYDYPRPALSADVVAFTRTGDGTRVLLVRRGQPPFLGEWAVPGGFVNEGEALVLAARRELAEETGLETDLPLVQVGTFGDPGRDPRGWTVAAVYAVVIDGSAPLVRGGDDAAEARWHDLECLPQLAFDHDLVVAQARLRMGV